MPPFLFIAATAGLTLSAANAQTPIVDGTSEDSALQSRDARVVADTPVTEEEPNIDAALLEDDTVVEKPLPLSETELERRAKLQKLANEMTAGLEQNASVPEEVVNTPIPKILTQYQQAWEHRDADDGVYIARACIDCIHAVQPRELMVTSIQLPKIEKITGFDLGDSQSFAAEIRNDFTLAVKPLVHNVDTNLNIYTESGFVHGFYLRSLPLNSNLIPDLLVKIEDNQLVPGKFGLKTMFEVQKVIEESAPKQLEVSDVLDNLRSDGESDEDFVRSIEFDPATLTGFKEYRIYGSADEKLKPKVVFRDAQFTYIQWDNWDSTRLPTAYVVHDDLDDIVNTRVRGKTFIVESVADLISLKLGKSYICLKWEGVA